MVCLLTILTVGIGGAIFAHRRRRRQAQLYHLTEEGKLPGPDTSNMSCSERRQARKDMRAAAKAERRRQRGGCCCGGGGYKELPQVTPEPMAVSADPVMADQRDTKSDDAASEAVYTPRTEDFVHVDDMYASTNEPPAYDDSVDGSREYKDEKKSATPF